MPPSLEARIAALETQPAAALNRVIIYGPGADPPELPPGDGVVILLPDNHREDNPQGNP